MLIVRLHLSWNFLQKAFPHSEPLDVPDAQQALLQWASPHGWDIVGHVRDNDTHLIIVLFWVVISWYLSSPRL